MTNEELEKYYKELLHSYVILGEMIIRVEECMEQIEKDRDQVCSAYSRQKWGVEVGSRVLFNKREYEVSSIDNADSLDRPYLSGRLIDKEGRVTSHERSLLDLWEPMP